MNIPFLFFTSEQIIDSHLRYSDIFYFMFSTFVQTKVRPKKSGTDEGQRHLLMYGEIEECIPCGKIMHKISELHGELLYLCISS